MAPPTTPPMLPRPAAAAAELTPSRLARIWLRTFFIAMSKRRVSALTWTFIEATLVMPSASPA
jgi:hypothetical protein